ncbi:MAG TPA: FAD-dependent oxidoreductase, partial [Candidatus Gracilibacteria bacterium]|nr:FAD-dependent oxidoreductase [Candidatus Gracilibacteria bacterium]
MNKPKIVILGAGFGGIYTYLHLRKKLKPSEADIILVNKTNHFLFTPMLHEVATGGLGHHQIVESLREIIYDSDTNLYVANIKSVDFDAKKVHTN